ncbi:MAG: prolyl oligopeptidase family serine peptidase [Planctomycetes bacterium]|nr:prolyl oligopeptidase family serine peptidase [Planctomycetota bacterium]
MLRHPSTLVSRSCAALLLAACALPAEEKSGPSPPPAAPPGKAMLDAFLRSQVAEVAAAQSRVLDGVVTAADWERRRAELRSQLKDMLGLDPEPSREDLRAAVAGTVERPDLGIAVEKLHFQPVPGLYVTANVHRPLAPQGRLPAVLYLSGHGQVKLDGVSYGNKAHYQHHGAWFARNGYVCLVLDTLQLGEIEGKHHGTYRLGMWWWASRGYTPAGVEAWTSVRAIDYLAARPDVDPARIGVTGRSGGGTGSWWLAALDDRPAAFAPVAGTTDLQNHVIDGCIDGHCDCNYTANYYRWDYPTVASLAAPRPVLHLNSDKDSIFPLDGVLRVHAALKGVYGLLGSRERLGLTVTEGPHADTQDLQVPAFRWMARWLKGDALALVTHLAEKVYDPRELKALAEVPKDERNTSIEESFVAVAAAPEPPADLAAFEGLRAKLLEGLKAKPFRSSPEPPARPRLEPFKSAERDGLLLRGYALASEGAFRLPLWIVSRGGAEPVRHVALRPADEHGWTEWLSAGAAAFAAELGVEASIARRRATEDLRRRLAEPGLALAVFPPRGVGPTRWSDGPALENRVRRRFLALGRTVEEGRVHDVRLAARAARLVPGLAGASLTLEAEGDMAAVALYAGILEPSVERLELARLPASHRQSIALLGVQRVLDIPQAVALAFPRKVVLLDVDEQAFAWPRRAAEALARAAGPGREPPLEIRRDRRWVGARAHAIPKHTTSEGSGYFSIVEGRNAKLYVGTAKYRENAFLVELDPADGSMRVVVDAMKEIGSTVTGFAAQAKIHTRNNAGESGRIYFGTKQGYPKEGEDRSDYPGGYPMVYDPATGSTRVYAIPVPHQGVISVTPDESRGIAYVSTCSDGRPVESTHFLVLDLATGKYRDLMDCRHMYAFIVVDWRGRAYHPILGGDIARFDPSKGSEGTLERLSQTIDGAPPRGSLLAHPESHPINWEVSPDRKTLYAVAMNENQLYAYDLTADGSTLPGRSLGKLLAGAKDTDCRALCVGPEGEVWAAVTTRDAEAGQVIHLVSWRPGDPAPLDHGPIAVENPDYTELTGVDGKPLPWHHGMKRLADCTLVPLYPMGVCQGRDGRTYVTAICPYTVLEVAP